MSDSWVTEICPNCKSKNWICMGNVNDMTSCMGEEVSYICWHCKKQSWREEIQNFIDNNDKIELEMFMEYDFKLSNEENLENSPFLLGLQHPA